VRDNIIFNQFGFGLHGYTETAGALRNLLVSGNILFNNGELSTFDSFNLLVGGPRAADNDVIADNLTYFSPGFGGLNVRFGFPFASVINGQAVVRDNYFVGGKEILEMGFWEDMNVHDNTFIGSGDMIRLHDPNTSGQTWSGNLHFRDPTLTEWRYLIPEYTFPAWQAATGLAATDQAFAGTPGATRVFVRPNVYEAGRATVAVYNWSGAGTVPIDLTGVVTPGHVYEIRNVQRVFDPPVATGTYGGGAVPLSLTGVTAYAPIGGSPNPPLVTGPDFDVFLVTSHEP
jgi:hypothetical protein